MKQGQAAAAHNELAKYVDSNYDRIIGRWKDLVVERLALDLETSQLLNDIPEFVKNLVHALHGPADNRWFAAEGAKNHGRQRLDDGIDMGTLSKEMMLVAEAIFELAQEDRFQPKLTEIVQLNRALALGTAASITAFATLRDQKITNQAARHFSFIAHELRTPLQSARLALNLLRVDREEARAKHLERLARSLSELQELVDDSLVSARLESQPDMSVETVNVKDLIVTTIDNCADLAEARSIRIHQEIEDFELEADYKLLISAVQNLAKNAVKFTRENGSITVRAWTQGNQAQIEVQDQCGGMPEDLPARLFQPFVQESADRSGFGLGLVITKRAVEAHRGTIQASNRPGDGCTFVLELPLCQPSSKTTATEDAS